MALCHSKLLWCYVQILTLQKPHIPASFNMYLVINKWIIAVKVSNFSGQYLRNHWTLGIGVLGYIGIVWPKEHSPEVWSVPPVTLSICSYIVFDRVPQTVWYVAAVVTHIILGLRSDRFKTGFRIKILYFAPCHFHASFIPSPLGTLKFYFPDWPFLCRLVVH